MSSIVLSASVRQNLLSLQSTAELLSTTQSRLSTGKKVNSALDNPTNFFTAASLDNRASDINNLLDGIGNGVQVLQAANAGIGSIQKLVDTAKSIGQQVLQAPTGYTSFAHVDFTGAGAGAGVATEADLSGGGTGKFAGASFYFGTEDGTLGLGFVGQNASLTGLNKTLSNFGLELVASLTGPNTLTFTSTKEAAGQIITTAVSPLFVPVTTPNTLLINTGASEATAGSVVAAVPDPTSQAVRANLVTQYNNILAQITTTAQDSSFNGINLLNGDNLRLTFNETGKSTLSIQGVTFNPGGLGLASLTSGTDFLDSSSANAVISKLGTASSALRSEASTLGSNLSIVQIRQDFSKNLINVLQTGSSNLTLADTNEEAANSQALSTRQSIAVSALGVANPSQPSVLQLLR